MSASIVMIKRPSEQFIAVLIFELIVIALIVSVAMFFWGVICGEGAISDCLADSSHPKTYFFGLSLIRPLFFSPVLLLAMIAGGQFGPYLGTFLTCLGAAFSALLIYFPAHHFGSKMVRPWLLSHLPNTWRFIRTQDYKIVFITRWVPVFPFDLMSLLFGIADFHAWRVFFYSFIGSVPAVFLFSSLSDKGQSGLASDAMTSVIIFAALSILPLLLYEYILRKRKGSLWVRLKRVYYEIFYEVQMNNEVVKSHSFNASSQPVILLYGFFSSRRTLSVLEHLLVQRGFHVMSFNLGGVLGVFFTRGIKESAAFLDQKIKNQMDRYGFQKVSIVAHSKGGLVALWWLTRMGGYQFCDRVVTMGTPFRGSYLTYLLLITPLGFIWKDIWQMRPGSKFLRDLHSSPVVDNVTIYNMYSEKDRVATGRDGIFNWPGRVVPVPMHHLSHFEYLYKRTIGDSLSKILHENATESSDSSKENSIESVLS